ncbi:HAUS augmin-like complex subunit 6 [Eudromia elegans]
MFDAPNNDAFHAVALFLFDKLDPSRATEMFRECSALGDRRGDPEFRKQCFTWLKEIAEEDNSTFPQMAASLLLSAGGPKFIELMYKFARYVLIKDIKVNSVGTDIPFTDAANLMQDDPHLTKARARTACNKLLQILQKEDFITREHEKKVWLLKKEIRKLKLECASVKLWLLKKKQDGQSKIDKTERIQKVRSMWTFIMDTLTSLKKEKEVVDSVLDGRADQYTLDGTNLHISIPQLLVNRIESEMHKLCIGKIHQEEKLNFLTIVLLLNEALRIFRDEFNQRKSKQHLQSLRSVIEFQNIFESVCDGNYDIEDDEALENVMDESILTPEGRLSEGSEVSSELISSFGSSDELPEQVFCAETFNREEQPISPNILKCTVDEPGFVEAGENKDAHIIQRERPLREDPLEKAQQELAEEVAKAVMCDSSQSSGEKGMELEDIINSLSSNPFIPRKQIPRTPENLLTEIRSSWRKAVRNEDSPDPEMSLSETTTENPKIVRTISQKRIPDYTTSSPVINFDYYPSERKSHLSCTELSPEKQTKIGYINSSSVKEKTRISESERIEKQELENILNQTEAAFNEKKSIDTQDSFSEKRRIVLSPEHFEDSFMDRVKLFDSSFDSREPAQLGILHGILSEPDESPSSELDFDIPDKKCLPGSTNSKRDVSVDFESVLSRYETLKRTLSRNEEELQIPTAGESLNCSSDLIFTLVDTEESDTEKTFYLDEDFLKTVSSPVRLNESTSSLSPLLIRSRYLERMASALHRMPFDSERGLKGEEHLSEKLDTKEPS